jgi:hypothetical protein
MFKKIVGMWAEVIKIGVFDSSDQVEGGTERQALRLPIESGEVEGCA